MYVYIYIYIYIYICIYIYIYNIYIHTYIHTYVRTYVRTHARDIIAWKGNTCEIIDTRICLGKFVINEAHSRKVAYYDQPAIHKWCEDA